METLLAGYRRFRANASPAQRHTYEALADRGQHPHTLVITCIDSRVDPAVIFDAAPGEMLTVRNVANLVPPFSPWFSPGDAYHGVGAALEFGVKVLGVEHIVVLGHSHCGGVQALLEGPVLESPLRKGAPKNAGESIAPEFIAQWMSIAEPARQIGLRVAENMRRETCEHETVKVSLANLKTFPWIADRVRDARLKLHGAWFDIGSGALLVLEPGGSFTEAA